MSRALRLIAPAKVNWTLEVLRIRPDGYHELRSVLQTVDLCDLLTLTDAPSADVVLDVTGPAGETLAGNPTERNLAYRAAVALRARARTERGVRITLEKHVPVAAGLGGGSSDAAAVLRGLDVLWGLRQPREALLEVAAEIGSDPPFFVVGGTAAVRGRGDAVDALPDAVVPPILLATPPAGERGEKTATMFAALSPADFSDGEVSAGLREAVAAGRRIADGELNNVFERVTPILQPETALAMGALRAQGWSPHLAGAGPSFFLLLEQGAADDGLLARVRALGFEPRVVRALSREHALRVEEG
ncbi:MAG: 4-(cytidine 5'-diphospho)-2-C-methyl-D-erythritol kinase [Chloroflexota bacterium]|nr:4-(cytidine 5'-diphospho)-2-C-methyl-D-erythritol kinase [Chloroflexota bacterium]